MEKKMSKTLNKKLADIQQKLNAPKNQYNSFGKYSYRSCEDILEAVKPLLGDLTLTLHDDIQVIGPTAERVYVRATATINDGEHSISVSALARESETKKGMDASQITGATSSYARKYALNGLFLIDDSKDADTDESKGGKKAEPKKPEAKSSKTSFRRKKKTEEVSDDDDI
jgi:hypothetical protein